MQILREEASAGLEIGDQRRALRDAREVVEREADAGLVRNRRNVQRCVGRAARCSNGGTRVFETLPGDELARQRAVFDQLHDGLARLARERGALFRHRGQRCRAGQREPERLGNHRHGVGGELAGTRAERGEAHALELVEFRPLHIAREHRAYGLVGVEHRDIAPLPPAGQRCAAVDENRRQVEPHHRHHHPGQRLVAAGEGHERIVGMPARYGLDAIGDDLARDERVAHAAVVHRHRVRDRDRREIERHAARIAHRRCGITRELAEQCIARRYAAVGRSYADKGLGEIGVGQPEAAQERAVRRAVEAFNRDAGAQFLRIHARSLRWKHCAAARVRLPAATAWLSAPHP